MPKKRVTIKEVYQFDELDERAKERARDWWREGALDYEWWDGVYEDAERAGLTIEGFDLGRAQSIEGQLNRSAKESIEAILGDHGKDCDTYKLALQYQAGLDLLDPESDEYEDELETLTKEYEEALKEEYWHMLNREMEYLLSDEQVDESIQANEYEFLEDGRRA